jgi:hypothetical protein
MAKSPNVTNSSGTFPAPVTFIQYTTHVQSGPSMTLTIYQQPPSALPAWFARSSGRR